MASFRLKRKTFGMFGLTIKNFQNMKNAFNTGNMGQAAKFGAKTVAHAGAGVAKGALGVGGVGLAAATAFDNIGNK